MSRHWGSELDSRLRVARVIERTEVLGPGRRAVIVVQGCHLRCRGCIAEETHALGGGLAVGVRQLSEWLGAAEVSGVTFTGGEPFLQAAALSRLLGLLRRERRDLSAMSYSGYRLEWLRRAGSAAQRALLGRLDLLIDGPYVQRLHAPLLWRGSRNQRIHALTSRHRAELAARPDSPAGMEWEIDSELRLEWVGVPAVPGFRSLLLEEEEGRIGLGVESGVGS